MKKSFKVILFATLFLFVAVYGYAATISDSMTFNKAATFKSTATITSPMIPYGYTAYAYSSGTGATYSVASTVTAPTVYKITGGSGLTTFVMTYTGTSAGNVGKMFYIINSSSNTVTFKQYGGYGVDVATNKVVTVIGDGTNFVRITADQ